MLGAFFITALDYVINRPKVSPGRYLFLIGVFLLVGFLNDYSLIWLNFVTAESYHLGNLSLWVIFIAYYEDIFVKFKKLPVLLIAVIGSMAGVLTYWSAAKLGAIVIIEGMETPFIISQLLFWAVFFPLSLKFYFAEKYWDYFLDKTIFFSFDRTGFLRHQNKFLENLELKKSTGKTILVTGATTGIGAEAAAILAQQGGEVLITGRNRQKGADFVKQNPNSKFLSLDMADWDEVFEFAKNCDPLDDVIFNAGSMPEKMTVNKNGIEFQCASQLLGHYYLLIWLKKFQKLKPGARIVWVSSGGMYLKKMDLPTLFKNPNYDKVETYANVKRAQVTLVEELSKSADWKDYYIYSMHPGWVGTEGLREALPGFYRFMQKRLRTPKEGADTIVWCVLTENAPASGGFYFDRKQVSPYISKKFNPTTSERSELIKQINDLMTH